MRIGIGLDETISALPQWFSILTRAFLASGNEVHVITCREPGTNDEVAEELAQLGVTYTQLHVPIQSVSAPTWKSHLATELGLDMMIDDSPEVLAKMPHGTARLWLSDPEVFDLDVCVKAMSKAPAPQS